MIETIIANEATLKILEVMPATGLYAGLLVLACNAITMFLPTKLDGKKSWHKFANPVLSILNLVSLNILKNKNKDAK